MHEQPIFLWGFMGSGKSRLGKRMATKMGKHFLDLDQFIENRENQTITSIFTMWGEQYFRDLEANAIENIAEEKNVIIACGGGTPCYNSNAERMKEIGICVFLDVENDILIERLWRNKATRPLIAKMKSEDELADYVELMLNERMPFYSKADLVFDNSYPKSSLNLLIDQIQNYSV